MKVKTARDCNPATRTRSHYHLPASIFTVVQRRMSPASPLFSSKEEQKTNKNNEGFNREEEYSMAKRAAVEATMVGRETLETALRQGEQLKNSESLAEDTDYKLDRATRLLRGMTWSGWWANKFSSDVEPPDYKLAGHSCRDNDLYTPPKVYDSTDIPSDCCRSAAQAVQNYHANLQVLEACETIEQTQTCEVICEDMYQKASQEVTKLQRIEGAEGSDSPISRFAFRLGKDLKVLKDRQEIMIEKGALQTHDRPLSNTTSAQGTLFAGKTKAPVSPQHEVEEKQEAHLDFMLKHLNELGSLASNLNTSLAQHSSTLDSLEEKSDSMLYKSKMVTRRTDRMIQKKSWTKAKKEYLYEASIQHVASGKYLAVSTSNSGLRLAEKLNETCIFSIWQRQTAAKVLGLQSKYSHRWIGQNLLGNLVCSAYSFDRREEWDTDLEDWSRTPLLCASAGWGNGGYLLVREEPENRLAIGNGGLNDKKDAAIWCIKSYGPRATSTP